jgi:hypothetical protein
MDKFPKFKHSINNKRESIHMCVCVLHEQYWTPIKRITKEIDPEEDTKHEVTRYCGREY